VETLLNLSTQARHGTGKLVASRWCLTEPKRYGGRSTMSIFHADDASFDTQNTVGCIAELEDVACETLDRQILIYIANPMLSPLNKNLKMRIRGVRAARVKRS